jgi:hypothetical protein
MPWTDARSLSRGSTIGRMLPRKVARETIYEDGLVCDAGSREFGGVRGSRRL